jgi:hypothetical protein
MILEQIRQLDTGTGRLRNFGLLVGTVLFVLGAVFWIRHRTFFAWFLIPGVVLMVAGGIAPRALKSVYVVWMTLAIVLGFIVSSLLLMVLFFLVITPIGLVARLVGKDFLKRRLNRSAESYWTARMPARKKEDYERQF